MTGVQVVRRSMGQRLVDILPFGVDSLGTSKIETGNSSGLFQILKTMDLERDLYNLIYWISTLVIINFKRFTRVTSRHQFMVRDFMV